MKNFYFLFFLILSQSSIGQNKNKEVFNEKTRIDSIVQNINSNQKKYNEGIAEGSFHATNPKEEGGWGAYYLYKENINFPVRIIYNEALEQTYKSYKFYYEAKELIFASLNVDFYNEKNKSVKKSYYYKNSDLFYESKKEQKKYNSNYIKRTEQFVLKMIQL